MESTVMHKNLLKYFHNIPQRKNYRGTYSTNSVRCVIKHAIDKYTKIAFLNNRHSFSHRKEIDCEMKIY